MHTRLALELPVSPVRGLMLFGGLAVTVAALCAGCRGKELATEPPYSPIRPSSWTVTPWHVEMSVGDTARFQVTLYGPQGDTIDPRGSSYVVGELMLSAGADPRTWPDPLEPVYGPAIDSIPKVIVIRLTAFEPCDVYPQLLWGEWSIPSCTLQGCPRPTWENRLPPLHLEVHVQ
jgi:hypothetical protein